MRKSYWLAILVVLAMVLSMVPVFAGTSDFGPVLMSGNDPAPGDLQDEYDFPECELKTVKINDPITGNLADQTGKIEKSDPSSSFDVYIDHDPNTNYFSFSGATQPVYYVFVKAGPGGNLYGYPDSTRNGTNLISPVTDSISHITFYFCEPQTGSLVVNKTFDMGDTVNPDAVDKDFTIKIVGPSYPAGDTKSGTGNDTLTWDNLIVGSYTVTEEDLGLEWTVDIAPGVAAVPAGGTATVNVTNTYRPGCLKITKEWIYVGETGDYIGVPVPPSINVLIEGPSYPQGEVVTIYPDAQGKWTYETCFVLIPGPYTVTELNVDRTNWAVTYDVGAGEVAEPTAVQVVAGDKAEVTIRNYFLFEDDTFWAYAGTIEDGGKEIDDLVMWNSNVPGNPSNAWGWTNFINAEDTYTWDLWAGAGQNDTRKGYKVGTLTVVVTQAEEDGPFSATVNYNVVGPFVLDEYHLWVGDTPLFEVQRGRRTVPTAAPGLFPYGNGDTICGLSSDGFWVAAHGVVRVAYNPLD